MSLWRSLRPVTLCLLHLDAERQSRRLEPRAGEYHRRLISSGRRRGGSVAAAITMTSSDQLQAAEQNQQKQQPALGFPHVRPEPQA